jgi:hypothetical protein
VSLLPLVFHPRVYDQLDETYLWWAKHHSAEQAGRWFRGIEEAMNGLKVNPERHGFAAENDRFPIGIRALLFGLGRRPTHRVLFTIRPDCVFVLTVLHVAQDAVQLDDL